MRALPWLGLAAGLLFASAAAARDKPSSDAAVALESVVLMPLDGALAIDTQGKVTDLRIDTTLPDSLRARLDRVMRAWRFEPETVDGVARPARADMHVVLAARPVGDAYEARIDSVNFQRPADLPRAEGAVVVSGRQLTAPAYPAPVLRQGIPGKVLVGIRVDRDGHPAEVAIVQSALFDVRVHGRGNPAQATLRMLESTVRQVAATWTFDVAVPPGVTPTPEQLTVLVPVRFFVSSTPVEERGRWRQTVRTPRQELPWMPPDPRRRPVGVADVSGTGPAPVASALRLISDPTAGGVL